MRVPISVDSPTERERQVLYDRERATSPVYEHLITNYGLGVAERWLDALECSRGTDILWVALRSLSPTNGWVLSATEESEHIAKRAHPRPSPAVMALSLREWRAAQQRYRRARRNRAAD